VLMVYSFISVWFVGGLTVFHLYLIGTNQVIYQSPCLQLSFPKHRDCLQELAFVMSFL
jgi:hypothetical protein